MPPKSGPAGGGRGGRGFRFTARKRIPNYSSTVRVRTRSSSSAAATDSAPAAEDSRIQPADVVASLDCSDDAGIVRASGTMNAPGETPRVATPVSGTQSEGLRQTLAANSRLAGPDTDRNSDGEDQRLGNSIEPESLGVERLGSEEILRAENVTASRSEDGSKKAVDLPCVPELGPQVDEGRSVQSLTGPESGGNGHGKRKVVRKTVRVVKKVIKKRVPKRVLSNSSNDQGLMGKTQSELSLSEETLRSNLSNDVTERSNDAGEMSGDVNTVVEKSNEFEEKANITSVSEPFVSKKGHDPSGADSMETDTSNIQFGMSIPEQMVDERCDYQSGIHTMDVNVQSNEGEKSDQAGKVNYPAETVTYTEEIENLLVENQSNVSVAETPCVGVIDKDDKTVIAHQNLGLEGKNDEVVIVGNNDRKLEKLESGNGERESDSIRVTELSLSGEMEALERKKRRKTEIFVGGLDKNANENDIREVLNEVGEILDVRLAMNAQTGKNKGFAFVRFATAADAKKALEEYSKVEIRGKQCGVVPVEGNDTIFLGNIDKYWKTEDVVRILETAGIEKIDKVTLKTDPRNILKNRGFAFVEFETCRDAQIAFDKLQKKDAFGRNPRLKVAWAQPLVEPDEQEILKVKSVYAEFLPSTWDEEKVREYFKRFGEIENIVLAKDLPTSRRKDFAFINYATRDAAIASIEAINREKLVDGGSKVKIAVSLAKPISKSKQMKHTSDVTSKQLSNAKPKRSQTSKKHHEPRQKGKLARNSHHNVKVDNEPSTTDELVQILRQQASSNQMLPPPRTGPSVPDYDYHLPGSKRPYSLIAHDPLYMEPRLPPRLHMESSYPISGPSSSSYGVGLSSFPYHQERPGFASESVSGMRYYPDHFKMMGQAPYYGNGNIYRRY